jgi:hypothetical protein
LDQFLGDKSSRVGDRNESRVSADEENYFLLVFHIEKKRDDQTLKKCAILTNPRKDNPTLLGRGWVMWRPGVDIGLLSCSSKYLSSLLFFPLISLFFPPYFLVRTYSFEANKLSNKQSFSQIPDHSND